MSCMNGAVLALLVLAAGCVRERTYSCPQCSRHGLFDRLGEIPCRECLRTNHGVRCPRCGHEEVVADRGPVRCGRCRDTYAPAEAPTAPPKKDPAVAESLVSLAGAYARRGDAAAAFEQLEKAFAEGYSDRARLESDPALSALRSDPRWARLLERIP